MRRRRKGPDALLTAKLDAAASALIRSRGYCEGCGRTDRKLDCAHIVGRQNRRLRWDRRNLMALCFVCHRRWHDFPLEAADWIREHRPADVLYLDSVKNEIARWTVADKKDMLADLKGELVSESEGMEDAA